VGILAVTAVASCSSKGDPPAAQPGVAAGKVLELSGTVTATRGSAVRTLATGGEISADDVIDTSADGRVVILVSHNNARWDLGPNKHSKVSESIAWTAAKQDRPATAVIEESGTAGRHAEKTAATTDTTTAEPRQMIQDPGDGFQTKSTKAPEPSRAPAVPSAQPMPPADQKMEAPKDATKEATNDAREEATRSSGRPSDNAGADLEVGRRKADLDSESIDPVRELQREIREMFARDRVAMRACFDAAMPPVLVQIMITNGVYTITTVDRAATTESRACLAKIAKSLSSPMKIEKTVSIKYTLNKN
nr:hypothetical protein [Deltaproteobacteria bacterium]